MKIYVIVRQLQADEAVPADSVCGPVRNDMEVIKEYLL